MGGFFFNFFQAGPAVSLLNLNGVHKSMFSLVPSYIPLEQLPHIPLKSFVAIK